LPRGIHTIPLSWIRVDPSVNVRNYNTKDLEESIIRLGLMTSLAVTEDIVLVDGYLRYKCLAQSGQKNVTVMVLKIETMNSFKVVRNTINLRED
jgi:ParB-like chromosome segregation protein Spo0J